MSAYQIACKSGLLSPGTWKLALVCLGHHQAHRDSLAKLVADAGGKPVEPKTDAPYIEELKLGSLKTEGDVVALATARERCAASAYHGQHPALRAPKPAPPFASMSPDQAHPRTHTTHAPPPPLPHPGTTFRQRA